MNFSEALELLKVGKTLRRRGWNGKGLSVHLWIADGLTYPTFRIEDDEHKTNTWIPSISDILSDDWEIVSEEIYFLAF